MNEDKCLLKILLAANKNANKGGMDGYRIKHSKYGAHILFTKSTI